MGKLPEVWLDKLKQKNIWLPLDLTEINLLLRAKFLGSAPVPHHPIKRQHWHEFPPAAVQGVFIWWQFWISRFSLFPTDSSLTAPICRAGTNVCTSAQKVDQGTDVAEKQQKVSPHSQGYFSGVLFPRLPKECKGLGREPQGSSGAPTHSLTHRWNLVHHSLALSKWMCKLPSDTGGATGAPLEPLLNPNCHWKSWGNTIQI